MLVLTSGKYSLSLSFCLCVLSPSKRPWCSVVIAFGHFKLNLTPWGVPLHYLLDSSLFSRWSSRLTVEAFSEKKVIGSLRCIRLRNWRSFDIPSAILLFSFSKLSTSKHLESIIIWHIDSKNQKCSILCDSPLYVWELLRAGRERWVWMKIPVFQIRKTDKY